MQGLAGKLLGLQPKTLISICSYWHIYYLLLFQFSPNSAALCFVCLCVHGILFDLVKVQFSCECTTWAFLKVCFGFPLTFIDSQRNEYYI